MDKVTETDKTAKNNTHMENKCTSMQFCSTTGMDHILDAHMNLDLVNP
jgi:hypothetical protein